MSVIEIECRFHDLDSVTVEALYEVPSLFLAPEKSIIMYVKA